MNAKEQISQQISQQLSQQQLTQQQIDQLIKLTSEQAAEIKRLRIRLNTEIKTANANTSTFSDNIRQINNDLKMNQLKNKSLLKRIFK